jgi:hypothetical protein
MKEEFKKKLNEEHQYESALRQSSSNSERKFDSVEDLLRYDANQTNVPEHIENKLKKTIAEETPKIPFWKRWFKKY